MSCAQLNHIISDSLTILTSYNFRLSDITIDIYIQRMEHRSSTDQQLGVEVEYRPTDEGQGRDGLIFDAHHRCLSTFLK